MKFTYILMLLGALVLVLMLSSVMKRHTVENFDSATIDKLQALDKYVTNKKARRYNKVSDAMDDFLPGYLTPSGDNEDQASKLIKNTMNTPILQAASQTANTPPKVVPSGYEIVRRDPGATHAPSSDIHKKIKFCESLKGSGEDVCNALDNPAYQECGVCLKEGIDSLSKPTVGGLFFSKYDRMSQDQLQANVDPMFRKLLPTVGKCKDNRNFVTTGDRCRRRRKQLLCEAQNALPPMSPGMGNDCSQCVEQGLTFIYRGSKLNKFNVNLYIIAEGDVRLQYNGSYVPSLYAERVGGPTFKLSNLLPREAKYGGEEKLPVGPRMIVFSLEGVRENDQLNFVNNDNTTLVLAGQWNDKNNRSVPFFESIVNQNDVQINGTINSAKVTNTVKPADMANFKIGTPTVRPADKSKNYFNLTLMIPAFLGEPDFDEDAQTCPTGGLLGTPASMTAMKSNPCFSANPNAPLSLKCVANLFLAAGGNVFGQGYPTNQAQVNTILTAVGTQNSIDKTMDFFNGKFNIANTGKDAQGNDLSIDTVNAARLYMLGIEIRSPCDINGVSGPLTNACLQYLYDNKGVGQKEGATYQSSFGSFTSYCTRKGLASPIKADGTTNTQAVLNAKSQGGVRAVQTYFSKMHTMANTAANAANSQQVTNALGSCYGIVVPPQIAGQTACDLKIIAEYDISKTPVNNTQMLRMTMDNNQEFGPMSDVEMVMVKNNGNFTFKKNTIYSTGSGPYPIPSPSLTITCRKARAVNFWVRCDGYQPANSQYLIDLRSDPNTPDSYIYLPGSGNFWNDQDIYIDAKKTQAFPWPTLLNTEWHLISIIFKKPFNGDMHMFSRYSSTEGLAAEFGPITLYGDIPDPANPKKTVTLNETDINAFYANKPAWAIVPTFQGYQYKGCFGDSWSRALPYMLGQVSSQDQCASLAKNANMNTFGVQYSGQCWGGNTPDNDYKQFGSRQGCSPLGDGWTNQVYQNPNMKPTLSNTRAQARHSGKCLDIYGGQQSDGTRVIQYSCHGGDNQRFNYDPNSKIIRVRHSGKCLTVKSADAWSNVIQLPCVGTWNQQWDLNDDATVTLSGTNMTMDVKYASGGDLADLIIWPKNGGNNQKFNKIQ
jgi:Ricin-type beta-trefoil lectin domain